MQRTLSRGEKRAIVLNLIEFIQDLTTFSEKNFSKIYRADVTSIGISGPAGASIITTKDKEEKLHSWEHITTNQMANQRNFPQDWWLMQANLRYIQAANAAYVAETCRHQGNDAA